MSNVPSGGSAGVVGADGRSQVVAELEGKLNSLLHVHRQLLRKFAVVDAEAADMSEALLVRDARIHELHRGTQSAAERYEHSRADFAEALERERREARAAREELAATVQALRAYYEGQRQGAAAARAAAAAAAAAAVQGGAGPYAGVLPRGGYAGGLQGGGASPAAGGNNSADALLAHSHAHSPTVLKPLRGRSHVSVTSPAGLQ